MRKVSALSPIVFAAVACSSNTQPPNVPLLPRPVAVNWPTRGWVEATPESQGFNSGILADALLDARAKNLPVHNVLVVRHGKIILDAYFYPFRRGSRHDIASVTKSVTSILTGAAVHEGQLSFDRRLVDVIPVATSSDSRRDHIAVENLLAMQSGFDCGFARGERELVAMQQSANWIDFAAHLPMRSEPGTEYGYCSPGYHLLSGIIQRATGMREDEYARRALFTPLGITDVNWPRDPQGVTHGWGDLQLEPRDLAKLGFLYLHGGRWETREIVSTDWVERSTTARTKTSGHDLYGSGWWTNTGAPPGFFEAIGRGGQRLSVWPAKDIVVVILGGGFEPGVIGAGLIKALVADTALPPNPQALERLRNAIALVATPVAATSITRSDLERTISGRTYTVDDNALGLRRFTLTFDERRGARARLELRDRILDFPVGLDGRFRISDQAIDGIYPGARGTWRTPAEFVLELDLIGKIDDYTLDMTFAGDSATVDLNERTGLMHQTLHARR